MDLGEVGRILTDLNALGPSAGVEGTPTGVEGTIWI